MEQEIKNANQQVQEVSDSSEIAARLQKLEALRLEGNDPYEQVKYEVTATAKEIQDNYADYEGKEVALAGRIMSKRVMGKASFIHVQDGTGRIQSYVRIDALGEEAYAGFKKLDVGDIIGLVGEVFTTHKGEISVKATKYTLLSKGLLPLPEKYHGLKDQDTRYRQRYVDLIVNPEVKDTFIKRSQIITAIREYLNARGYIEVDTPILNTIPSGANARPFVTHHNTLDLDMYLRIAPELYLKRLIVGGFDKVYEMGRLFRNEGMDTKHNPEFTTIELYEAYTDYYGMMEIAEGLFKYVAEKVRGTTTLNYQGKEIERGGNWRKVTMVDLVKEELGLDFNSEDMATLIEKAKGLGVEVEKDTTWGKLLYQVFDELLECKLVQPTFVLDYPVEVSPLAKRKASDKRLTERFEFFMNSFEMGNAFSELNDPIDQRKRFEDQVKEREKGDDEAQMMDDDYVTALEYGLPPTGGMGIGIDRAIMLFTDSASIRDVLLFPTMKPIKG